jgi:gluconolactonase
VHDERLADLVAADSEVRRLATGFHFTEGPVWNPRDGYLLFTDLPGNTIHRWDERGGVSVWRWPSGMANGLTYDADLRLIACEAATSLVTRTEPDGSVKIMASHYGEDELNSPNDVVVRSDGSTYFTDPPSGRARPHGAPRPRYLTFQGVFRIPPGGGPVELLIDDMNTPNGLCFSPDEKRLYINDSLRMHIRSFDVSAAGSLSGGEILFTQNGYVPDAEQITRTLIETGGLAHGVPDGMKCDVLGNIWCTGHGGIWVISPDGEQLGLVETPETPANLAWGGEDSTRLFVCATTSVYWVDTLVAGCVAGVSVT